jgi:murein hydrolase activator
MKPGPVRRVGKVGQVGRVRRVGLMGQVRTVVFLIFLLPFFPYPPHQPYPPYPPHQPYPTLYALQAQQTERARVNERIAVLQREAEQLAGEARTLVGDLRALEVERDLQAEREKEAQAASTAAQAALQEITERVAQLDEERVAQLPDLKAQLVDIYKRGRGGYARLLLEADSVRDIGRTTRAVAALVRINEQRVADHRRTVEGLQEERIALEQKSAELLARETEARNARAAAEKAVTARAALIERIDARRDLNAQLAGELQVANERLQQQVANLAAGRPADAVAVPLAPFRGALEWPVPGRITAGVGRGADPNGPRTSNRAGGATVRNGIEIGAAQGTPVTAVHGGTIAYAEPFSGFGNLVIIDHGANNYSLYGYLASSSVQRGQMVESGVEVGRVGTAPAGPPALYFEMRIDGRSVDPVQWLKRR